MDAIGRLALPLLLCGLAACSGGPGEDGNAAAAAERARPAVPAGTLALAGDELERLGIRFVAVAPATELPLATVPATLAPPPNARVAVAAVIPGVVTRTLVVEGDSVARGQPLAVVAAREMFTLAAGVEQASARAAMARANDRRLGQLAREGVIAGARADEARAALREAEAELNEQQRVVRLVNGAPHQGTYTLTAPIAGKVTSAAIQTGSPVDGTAAAYVIDATSRYEVTAQIPERLVGRIHPGMAVRLAGDVRGEVTSVGSAIDPATRSALLRARIPAAPGVVSGRAVPVTIFMAAPDGAIVVPAQAVTMVEGKPSVFVRVAQGVAVRAVEAGDQADGRIVIRAGLKPGDRIAVTGVSDLKAVAGQD